MNKEKPLVFNEVDKEKVSRIRKIPEKKTKTEFVRGPGFIERTLMWLSKILKILLNFIEKRIQKFRAKRLAERMDGDNKI